MLATWVIGLVCSVAIGVVRSVRFRIAERRGTAGPAAVGFIVPRLVAPSDFPTRFTPEEWRLVRAHERSHMDRLDGRVATLATVGQWLCWFNPLAHLALEAFRLDQELVCDAAVMQRHPTERRRYAEMLMQSRPSAASPVMGMNQWAEGSLKVRIETLTRRRPPATHIALGAQALLLVWIAAFALGWAMHPPARLPPGWVGFGF